MPYITRNHPKLTQEGAHAVLAAAQLRAREIGIAMNIAIADEGGHMMVFSRMDGARISSVRIAIAKARAAAIQMRATGPADGDPSKVMMSLAIAITSLGIQTPMRGGLSLEVEGQCVGGIGVSNGTEDEDLDVARAGAAVLVAK
jgi:glc operon protein GlcG